MSPVTFFESRSFLLSTLLAAPILLTLHRGSDSVPVSTGAAEEDIFLRAPCGTPVDDSLLAFEGLLAAVIEAGQADRKRGTSVLDEAAKDLAQAGFEVSTFQGVTEYITVYNPETMRIETICIPSNQLAVSDAASGLALEVGLQTVLP